MTHRCAECDDCRYCWSSKDGEWHAMHATDDPNDAGSVHGIAFCPWCGFKLEEKE